MHKVSVDVEQDCAIELLIDDMGLEDLVVECLGGTFYAGHLDCVTCVPSLNKCRFVHLVLCASRFAILSRVPRRDVVGAIV